MSRRVVLSDHKAKLADRGLDIETDDGSVFHVDAPQLWPDEVLELVKANDIVGLAQELLGGDDQYRAFVAAGGSAGLLSSVVEEYFEASPGE